jgi:hypothetical protein
MKKILFLVVLLIGVFSCTKNPGTGSEIGNGKAAAMLYNHDGSPSVDARVLFVPVDYAPHIGLPKIQTTKICSTVTNDNGQYFFDSIPGGTYNVFGEKEGYQSFQDSVPVAGGVAEAKSDTLRATGSLSSHIELSNGLDYKTLIVIVLGSLKFSFVDSTGAFSLSNMAEGSYDVRILTTLDDLEAKDTVFMIASGRNEISKDTIRLTYKGVPRPTEFIVKYDTLKQTAILTWNPVDTALISGFNIYRAIKGNNFSLITQAPLPKTTAMYLDSSLSIDSIYEYRLVSRNKSGKESDFVDLPGDTVKAVSSSLATTILSLVTRNVLHDSASIFDTVIWILSYHNLTRKIKRVEWCINDKATPVKLKEDSLFSGSDTLKHLWSKSGSQWVYVNVVDAANMMWTDSVRIVIVPPRIKAGNDTTIEVNTSITFNGIETQRFGRILEYKWDFNGDGVWDDSSSSSSSMTTVFNTCGKKMVILEARDSEGHVSDDSIIVIVATFIQGVLNSDLQMKKSNSPYIITGNLLVPTDVTLTVESGTSVLVSENVSIKIDGIMSAIGNENSRIIFSIYPTAPNTKKWLGIQYGENASEWDGTSGNILKFCSIEFSATALSGKIAPQVENCIIQNNITAMDFDGDQRQSNPFLLAVFHSKIINNLWGIMARLAVNTNLSHDTIVNDTNSAFYSDNFFTTCSIDSCFIEKNGTGIRIDRGTVSITRSVINDNGGGISYSSDGGTNVKISNNSITNNIGYAIDFTEHGNHGRMLSISITNNNIDSNTSGIKYQLEYLATNFTINNNNIINSQQYAFISGKTDPIPAELDVANNFWGKNNSTEISSIIYDFYDSFDLSKVVFEPFATSAITIDNR